ncbi:MAG: ABC transporter permease [Armatimonadetes bacterium]|nr:ABC transporter permease [Armatimonadota bacterium]
MLEEFREFLRYRDLLRQLVIRDLKVRYKNSVMGFFWSLLNPLVQVAVMTVVLKLVMNLGIKNYSAYVLCAFLPWMFFQMALLDSAQSIIEHEGLVKKIYFPREVLPVSKSISNFIHFALAIAVFLVYLLILGTPFTFRLLLVPLLAMVEFTLILGLSLVISCLNVFYEDVKYIVTVLLQLFFYFSPVIYFPEQVFQALQRSAAVPEAFKSLLYNLYMLNPMATLLTAYRKLFLPPLQIDQEAAGRWFTCWNCGARNFEPRAALSGFPLPLWLLLLAAVVAVAATVGGYAFFNAYKWRFAERA